MTELRPLRRGAKMNAASKNDPNLPKTLPNSNFFQKNWFYSLNRD